METILCPYCECRVMISAVDGEGGLCPECGAAVTGAAMMSMDDVFDDDYDDDSESDDDTLDLDEEIDDDDDDDY